ncbi:hypothetical protein GCM10010909_20640 [Acidocella aquatica]|uniref:DUF2029 domain-containing protein n=1 Tax=Acidocella aquatica TaxID=1922313 RepID=A0ABQ6AAY0_9PROT|nr:glycosyltransferase family 87 protein [Acidocella aquatica]GLR67383.1 hypothetical protein GCM10010909_20640 [Acidocella aquatica]
MMPRRATTNPGKLIVTAMLGACAALNLAVLALCLLHPPALNSDFMAFWSFPRFAATHPIAQIYNATSLQGFQQSLYPGFNSFYPYLYPPTFLLPSWWLKFFSFAAAQWLWTLAGLGIFIAAVFAFFPQRPWLMLLALLASPASLLNGVTGETAYFTTALLFLGFAALPRRPLLAGIAFGLLTLKPQLGVLIPFFLLARGEWAAIVAASATALGLIALSCLAFPPGLWLLWAHTLPAYQTQYFASHGLNLNIIITPAANLVTLGVAPATAWAVQTLCSALAAALTFLAARRAPYPLAVAMLLIGSFLAVPHAYAYDTITLPAAMALCLTGKTPLWQVLLGCLVYLAPLLLLSPASHWFLYSLPESLLFATIAVLALSAAGSLRKTVVDAGP